MTRRKKATLPQDVVAVAVLDPELGYMKQRAASTRDDPLWGMLSRRQITQQQFDAGRRWQEFRGNSEGIGSLRGIDTTKEPVDGRGQFREFITDVQQRAVVELNRADVELGVRGREIVEMVLWQRYSMVQVSAALGFVSRKGVEYQGTRFRECLEALAKLWGLAS